MHSGKVIISELKRQPINKTAVCHRWTPGEIIIILNVASSSSMCINNTVLHFVHLFLRQSYRQTFIIILWVFFSSFYENRNKVSKIFSPQSTHSVKHFSVRTPGNITIININSRNLCNNYHNFSTWNVQINSSLWFGPVVAFGAVVTDVIAAFSKDSNLTLPTNMMPQTSKTIPKCSQMFPNVPKCSQMRFDSVSQKKTSWCSDRREETVVQLLFLICPLVCTFMKQIHKVLLKHV